MSHDREKDFRNRRDNRRDYSNERSRNTNSRWSEGGRSRENDRARPNSRDRNDRKSPMHDRLRNISGADNSNREFNNPRSNMQWNTQTNPLNFNNNFGMDQSNPPPRQMNMNAPPALEDIRIPIESLRGMPMMNNKPHRRNDYERRQMPAQQGREFYNQNRFGPPMNGPPMNLMRGNMQQFPPRNQSPMFMWQARAGL